MQQQQVGSVVGACTSGIQIAEILTYVESVVGEQQTAGGGIEVSLIAIGHGHARCVGGIFAVEL